MKTAALILAAIVAAAPAAAADLNANDLLAGSIAAVQRSDWTTGARLAGAALRQPALSAREELAAVTSLCVQAANAGDLSRASSACERSVGLAPGRWSGYLNRANVRMLMGDRAGATADYAMAKSLNPASPVVDQSIDDIGRGTAGRYVILVPEAVSIALVQQATAP
jgi:hypothetical protein